MAGARIVIDGRMMYWTGVGRYTQRLLTHLETLDHDNQYYVLMRPADWNMWQPQGQRVTKVRVDANPYTVQEQTTLVTALRRIKPDLVHFTAPNTPLAYRGKHVVTVHDLTLLDYDTSRGSGIAKRVRGLKRMPFRRVFAHAISSSTHIMTVSQFVGRQLRERYGVPAGKLTTTWLAAELPLAEAASIEKFGLPGQFLLYWGNYYPYKNVGSIIEALADLKTKGKKYTLALAGKPDAYGQSLMAQASRLSVESQVKFLGFVSDGELVGLCKGASVFVIPSLSEGFGLPGLEAMAEGLPVLAADASCLPEIYADAAVYFDPHDARDQADKIAQLMESRARRSEMSKQSLARAAEFSWEKTAKATLEVYIKALA